MNQKERKRIMAVMITCVMIGVSPKVSAMHIMEG